MKLFKKLSIMAIVLGACLTLAGCGQKNLEGNLTDLMSELYAGANIKEGDIMGLANTEINDENLAYYLGVESLDYKEAVASESMVGSIAHSVVLVRMNEGADIEKAKKEIKENVDPRKWICVGVEEEDIIVKNKGNLVVLIMVEDQETRDKLETGFDNL